MKSVLLALVPFVAAMAVGDYSYNWQSLGGGPGDPVSFQVVESDLDHLVADVTIPGFWLYSFPGGGSTWDRIELQGCTPQGETGFPELPSYPVLFALPFGTTAQVSVQNLQYTPFEGMSVYPRQPAEIDMPHAPWPFEMNDRAYSGGFLQPGAWASVDMDAIWSGLHTSRLVVNPFRFDAATGELQAASTMRIRIDFAGSATAPAYPVNPAMERAMASALVNYSQFRPLAQVDDTRDGAEYIVICNSANQSAVAPLYELRNTLGLKVQVEVLPSPASVAQIFQAVTDNYETGVTRFVLIAGTHAEMPSYAYSGHVGDYYYGNITGGDDVPELAVGRLTGDATQISHQVDKIIDGYLNYSFDDGNTTGIIPSMSVLAAHEEQYPGKYTQCCNEIAAYSYSLINFTFIKVYPPEGGTAQMVSDAINNGNGFVTYRGHGDVTVWSWSPGWSATNINALTNTFMPPVFNIACYCGRYQDAGNCLAEAWQFAANGASGNLAANNPSYTEANHTFIKEIYKAAFDQGTFAVQEAINASTVITVAQHGTYGQANARMYLWFGDPAQELWSFDTGSEPGVLNLTGPAVLNPGSQTITLTVTDGSAPVQGALVTLTDGVQGTTDAQTFYETALTNSSGQVSFTVTIPASGIIDAGAFKHDYMYDTLMWTVGVGIEEGGSGDIGAFWLGMPSPNPVTTSASFSYSVPESGRVQLAVYDVTGRLVDTIVSGEIAGGEHSAVWQPGQVASGVYFVRLTTPAGAVSRQVMVIR